MTSFSEFQRGLLAPLLRASFCVSRSSYGSFPGSAWERTVLPALPAGCEAEPREQWVTRQSLVTRICLVTRGWVKICGTAKCALLWSLSLLFLFWSGATASEPRVYRDSVTPHWFANQTRFWYRNDLQDGAREFVLVDAEKGKRQPAFDHARTAAELSKLLSREVTADKLPVERLEFEDSAQAVVLSGRDQAWRLDLNTHELHPCPDSAAAVESLPASRQPRPTRRTGAETRVTFENRTPGEIVVYWIDMDGQQRRYAAVAPGAQHDQHTYAGHVWLVTDRAGKPLGVFEAAEEESRAVVEGGDVKTAKQEARPPDAPPRRRQNRRGGQSPDGKWTVFLQDNNLHLRARETGEEFALSQDGRSDDGYDAGDLWWSSDSQKLVALRTQPAQEHKVYVVESSPKDQLQPKLRSYDYLKPGDRIAHPRPQLFDVSHRRQIAVGDELFPNPWSIQDIRWSADSSRFTFVYNQRGHQVLRVVAVDAATGAARAIVDERSDTFICYSDKFFCRWLGDDELIWMSERDGWNHLWLYDARSGQVKNQITEGPWVVQDVTHVDEDRRQIWFQAGGVYAEQDPYFAHFCRVNFDGSGMTVLTAGDGNHRVRWSPGEPYLLDTWSRVDLPPVTELRRSADGQLVCRLEEADASELLATRGGRWPERFAAKGRDGVTDVFGVILRPRDFDPTKKYPVVENIYAGPQGFFTPKSFRARYAHQQRIADLGTIVVQCDGMGTSGRSKKFHDVCWRNLRDAGFPDRIAWIQAAAAKHLEMDLSRVGIYGGSAGGQNALAALLWHGDFYRVAVADCGCHDNRMDKIWWNEQWMGWPVGKEYEENSNVVHAHRLQGRLMLIVGELDENVDPASTMQVVHALERADKDFDLVIVTGSGHGAAETPYGSRRRADFLKRHLLSP